MTEVSLRPSHGPSNGPSLTLAEQVELQSATCLDRVWRQISQLSPGGYQFTVLQDGPARWRMLVTHRQPAA